jgi:hypothetical protein
MRRIYLPIILSALLAFSFVWPQQTHASFVDDITKGVKNFIFGDDKKDLVKISIESTINLSRDGDLNGNGQIDNGDIIKFEYIIRNTTAIDYAFASINTQIERSKINYIHNIKGSTSLDSKGNTIIIPYIRLPKSMALTISFEARINEATEIDQLISTEPIFLDKNKKTVIKGKRIQKIGKKNIRQNNASSNSVYKK